MPDSLDQVRRSSALAEPAARCSYCGAPLNPAFYFCLACATPYKQVETVLPRPMPKMLTDGKLIEKKAPHVWPLFWTYLGVVIGAGVICFFAFGADRPDLQIFVQTAILLVTTCIFASLHWRALAVQAKRIGFGHPAAWIALLSLAPLLLINFVYHGWLWRQLGSEETIFDRLRGMGLTEGTLVVFICVFPAVLEEIAFRGLIQHWLQVAIRPWMALVLASALFTALHFSVISAPYLFAVGMLLGWAKWKTGSLYPSILIHFLHNFVVLEFFG